MDAREVKQQAIPVIMLLGPTGVGKTDLALWLAPQCGGEIVNADSLQLCRELEIGTAKPSRTQRAIVPHHLYDVIAPHEQLNAAAYARLAAEAIRDIHRRARLPILVGGTGFYLRALSEGFSPIPLVPDETRKQIEELEREKGLTYLYGMLQQEDPVTAARLQAADRARIKRALAVQMATGQRLSEYHLQPRLAELKLRCLKLGLRLPRTELYSRLNRRVEAMFESGLLAEVERLPGVTLRGIGYAEAQSMLAGEISRAAAVAKAQQRTRQYAKRQITWFEREPEVFWFDMDEARRQQSYAEILSAVAGFTSL
jgi:tRNA dimethylallyltransferase